MFGRRRTTNPTDPAPERPRPERGLTTVSGWWLLLWIIVAIAALWLLEQLDVFGF